MASDTAFGRPLCCSDSAATWLEGTLVSRPCENSALTLQVLRWSCFPWRGAAQCQLQTPRARVHCIKLRCCARGSHPLETAAPKSRHACAKRMENCPPGSASWAVTAPGVCWGKSWGRADRRDTSPWHLPSPVPDCKEVNHLERQPALHGAAPSEGSASTHPPPNQKLTESACGAGGVSRFVLEDSSSLTESGANFLGEDP